ncbi:MAG: hypothetical protein ACJA0I_001966, partial [Gammaproteobacteria bacterium]
TKAKVLRKNNSHLQRPINYQQIYHADHTM